MSNNKLDVKIPQLTQEETDKYLLLAKESARRRYPKILHKPGDEFNEVVNFIMAGSYMQPHYHPDKDKIEDIYIMTGRMGIIFFDDNGKITQTVILEKGGEEHIKVPAFAWHTYISLSDSLISYETMNGVYDPATWKTFATWAPKEGTPEVEEYMASLKKAFDSK